MKDKIILCLITLLFFQTTKSCCKKKQQQQPFSVIEHDLENPTIAHETESPFRDFLEDLELHKSVFQVTQATEKLIQSIVDQVFEDQIVPFIPLPKEIPQTPLETYPENDEDDSESSAETPPCGPTTPAVDRDENNKEKKSPKSSTALDFLEGPTIKPVNKK
jgi:hypothetical protein